MDINGMTPMQKRLIFGVVVGAAAGGVLAWLASGQEQRSGSFAVSNIAAGDWIKLGVGFFTIARTLTEVIERA